MQKQANSNGVTPVEAARHLRIGLDLVYKYLWSGKLRGAKQDGRWHITPESLQARIEQKSVREHQRCER